MRSPRTLHLLRTYTLQKITVTTGTKRCRPHTFHTLRMCAVHHADGRVPAVSSSGHLILDWPEALTKQLSASLLATRSLQNNSFDGLLADASAACKHAPRVGWAWQKCVASTASASDNSDCPARVDQTFSMHHPMGFTRGKAERMGCRVDGGYHVRTFGVDNRVVLYMGAFNRSAAFLALHSRCASFAWSHAADGGEGGKSRARAHVGVTSGPAIVGTDKDIGRALAKNGSVRAAALKNVNLLHLGMNYARRYREGLWTPCTNLAFMNCALHGLLPGQREPEFFLATEGRSIGRRCRPCGACNASQPSFDECFIVKSEYCLLNRACVNGDEVWHTTGRWTCKRRGL